MFHGLLENRLENVAWRITEPWVYSIHLCDNNHLYFSERTNFRGKKFSGWE
jgi:hypothetical protein